MVEAGAIEELLHGIQPHAYGWRCDLPPSSLFLGHPIGLEFETRPYPEEGPPPLPVQAKTELVRLILAGLPGVIAEAERRYVAFNADFPDVIAKADRPHIWVCREFMERDGPDRWAFATGISDAPDWTICIEFRGLKFLEIWAGG